MPDRRRHTFVLLHGAFHGAWCWRHVATALRGLGHDVVLPTQTGLGERRHLLSAETTLNTFVDDLTGVLEAEELHDVILVGHSFGGIAITGAADVMPQRIAHLVYLDARILPSGVAPIDLSPPDVAAERRRLAAETGGVSVAPPPPATFGVPDGPAADWIVRRMTPHPFRTFTSSMNWINPIANGRPATYVACTAPQYPGLDDSRRWAEGRPGWRSVELAEGHDAMVTAPALLTRLLTEIAS